MLLFLTACSKSTESSVVVITINGANNSPGKMFVTETNEKEREFTLTGNNDRFEMVVDKGKAISITIYFNNTISYEYNVSCGDCYTGGYVTEGTKVFKLNVTPCNFSCL